MPPKTGRKCQLNLPAQLPDGVHRIPHAFFGTNVADVPEAKGVPGERCGGSTGIEQEFGYQTTRRPPSRRSVAVPSFVRTGRYSTAPHDKTKGEHRGRGSVSWTVTPKIGPRPSSGARDRRGRAMEPPRAHQRVTHGRQLSPRFDPARYRPKAPWPWRRNGQPSRPFARCRRYRGPHPDDPGEGPPTVREVRSFRPQVAAMSQSGAGGGQPAWTS